MSILINMEMPTSCDECILNNGITCYAVPDYKEDGVVGRTDDRPDWCPLVPVPPHGRLLKVLKTERECVSRDCNRDCGKCDLSLEQDEVLSAYDFLITLFADPAEEDE